MDPGQLGFGWDAGPAAQPAAGGRRLPPDYPGRNLMRLCIAVEGRYADLLAGPEVALIEALRRVAPLAVSLWARLASRRRDLVRRDSVRCPELPEDRAMATALAELVDAGLVDAAPEASATELVALLRRPEAEELRAVVGGGVVARRNAAGLRRAILDTESSTLAAAVRLRVLPLRVCGREALRVLQLLFFGDAWGDLGTLVRADLGAGRAAPPGSFRFETYTIDPTARRFASRRDVDAALALAALEETVHVDRGDTTGWSAVAAPWSDALPGLAPPLRRRAEGLLLAVARLRVRHGDAAGAEAILAAVERPPARERLVRLLVARGAVAEAAALVAQIAAAPRDETEADVAPRLARLVARRGVPQVAVHQVAGTWSPGDGVADKAIPVSNLSSRHQAAGTWTATWDGDRRVATEIPVRELALVARPGVSIEREAAAALGAVGETAAFAENGLWSALLGLVLWDAVFAPVPGAFEHPYQFGPLDLGGPEFRHHREALIAARLDALATDPDPGPELLAVWDRKEGVANPFVSWDPRVRAVVELALSRLAGRHLAVVLDRASRDPRRYLRGLPDLFVATREPPGFALLEVKGPGDTLRAEQRAWLAYLVAQDVPAAVLRVRWTVPPFLPRRATRAEQFGLALG